MPVAFEDITWASKYADDFRIRTVAGYLQNPRFNETDIFGTDDIRKVARETREDVSSLVQDVIALRVENIRLVRGVSGTRAVGLALSGAYAHQAYTHAAIQDVLKSQSKTASQLHEMPGQDTEIPPILGAYLQAIGNEPHLQKIYETWSKEKTGKPLHPLQIIYRAEVLKITEKQHETGVKNPENVAALSTLDIADAVNRVTTGSGKINGSLDGIANQKTLDYRLARKQKERRHLRGKKSIIRTTRFPFFWAFEKSFDAADVFRIYAREVPEGYSRPVSMRGVFEDIVQRRFRELYSPFDIEDGILLRQSFEQGALAYEFSENLGGNDPESILVPVWDAVQKIMAESPEDLQRRLDEEKKKKAVPKKGIFAALGEIGHRLGDILFLRFISKRPQLMNFFLLFGWPPHYEYKPGEPPIKKV